jgi:hypothetical protein
VSHSIQETREDDTTSVVYLSCITSLSDATQRQKKKPCIRQVIFCRVLGREAHENPLAVLQIKKYTAKVFWRADFRHVAFAVRRDTANTLPCFELPLSCLFGTR